MLSKVEVLGPHIEFKYCGCGCQKTFSKYYIISTGRVRKDRERDFILGHHAKGTGNPNYGKRGKDASYGGKKHTEEWKKQSSERNKGKILNEKNWKWKGDNVKYNGLHEYVRRHLPKKEFCEICKKVPPYDLANITGIYNREFKNWGWFCRKCHLYYDNVIERTLKKGWGWNKKRLSTITPILYS